MLEQLKQENSDNAGIVSFNDLAKAFIHKYSNRMRDKVKSEELLQKIRKTRTLEHQYHRLLLIHLAEFYLSELAIYHNPGVIVDIREIIEELENLVPQSDLEFSNAEILLLKVKLLEIEGDIKGAYRIVKQGLEICDRNNFNTLGSVFAEQKVIIQQKRQILNSLNSEKLDLSAIDSMQSLILDIMQYRLKSEEDSIITPIFFQIIGMGGLSLYAKEFANYLEM